MIAYVDSSVLARSYLPDEPGHGAAAQLLEDPDLSRATGTCTRIEVAGALVRASRSRRGERDDLLTMLADDLGAAGRVTTVRAPQDDVETRALTLVTEHGLRAMDAWHLAVAVLVLPELAEPGEDLGFASRDGAQSAVAETLGFRPV